MNKLTRLTLAGLAGAGVAVAASAATPTPTYLAKAGAGDQFEIQSSKLLLASTANPALKTFAQEMVTDHTKSTADVKAAAMKSGLHPKPPVLTAQQTSDLAALRAAKGASRDKLYVDQQKTAHQDALALQQDYSSSGDKPALKAVAMKIVPVVQHHIEMLGQMAM